MTVSLRVEVSDVLGISPDCFVPHLLLETAVSCDCINWDQQLLDRRGGEKRVR